MTIETREAHRDRAVRWASVAAACLAIRAIVFGAAMTPSLRALFGIDDSDVFGRAASHRVRLEDPLLLVVGLGALAVAGLYAYRARPSDR
ncbi:MAG: hypothetical protein ACT4OU_12255 [Hyphomicrobium sp.]